MFLKPFRVKSQTAIKGSDRKKLRAEIARQYPGMDEDELPILIPTKEEMSLMKIYTHGGETVLVYIHRNNPIMFDVDSTLYPTVYTLWKYPDMAPVFTTWPPVLQKMIGGADLMLPGLIVPGGATPQTLGNLKRRALCSVKLLGNRSPIATGKTALSSEDMYESGMKGKGVLIIHTYKDLLWEHGDKSDPPMLEDPMVNGIASCLEPLEGILGEDPNTKVVNDEQVDDLVSQEDVESDGEDNGTDLPNMDKLNLQERGQERLAERKTPTEQMDELLVWCFKCAIKYKIKKSDLPLLTSKFQKMYLQRCCPKDKYLDLKKSSYKKLSKLLSCMVAEGYIQTKELSKGVDSITEVRKDHLELRGFNVDLSLLAEEEAGGGGDNDSTDNYQPPQITDMFLVTTNVLPIFKPAEHSKGSALSSQAVRKVLTEYVKEHELQDHAHKGYIRLDPVLSDLVLGKGDHRELVRWEDALSGLTSKMTHAQEVTFPGCAPDIRKGKLPQVTFNVGQRMGNKKVTLIENLEFYGVDASSFARRLQVELACSASVAPLPGNNKGMQITVQGNQIHYVSKLLTEQYGLQQRWLSGLDKAVKPGKKQR